jgi:hypothetical protein
MGTMEASNRTIHGFETYSSRARARVADFEFRKSFPYTATSEIRCLHRVHARYTTFGCPCCIKRRNDLGLTDLVTDLEPFVPDLDVNFSEREANPQPAESVPTTFVAPITKLAVASGRESAANTSRGGFPNRPPGSMHHICVVRSVSGE